MNTFEYTVVNKSVFAVVSGVECSRLCAVQRDIVGAECGGGGGGRVY